MSDRERVEALAKVLAEIDAQPNVSTYQRQAQALLASDWLRDLLAEAKADAWDEGRRGGENFEKAKWYWQGRNLAAMIAAGMPAARPERPANPYRETTTGGRDD